MTLTPYTGPWTPREAGHLLRRSLFGATYGELKKVVDQGLGKTLDELLKDVPIPSPPITVDGERGDPVGKTWVDRPFNNDGEGKRRNTLRAWQSEAILKQGINLTQQMVLFWHNHFALTDIADQRAGYQYSVLLHRHALGNLRQFAKEITIEAEMLRFLNGNQNRKNSPNENYARELMELFTLGKGEQVGPGDYSTYTEEDIRELARSLTGWQLRNYRDPESNTINVVFNEKQHDTTPKQLSKYFNNAVINDAGADEYKNVVDIIMEREAVASFIVRKLYRWFVFHEITPKIEREVIAPLAQLYRASDYEIKPVMRELLGSAYFFDVLRQGPMIKNPVHFAFSPMRQLEGNWRIDNAARQEEALRRLLERAGQLGMRHLNPPGVAGWKAYYQEPLYYRNWITTNTLQDRTAYTNQIAGNGFYGGKNVRLKVDMLALVKQFKDPGNLASLIDELTLLLMPRPLTDGQIAALKALIVPGEQPESQWTVEYGNYLANPNDNSAKSAVEKKLLETAKVMLTMPEYQLC